MEEKDYYEQKFLNMEEKLKVANHRIEDLEVQMKDIQSLISAIAAVDKKVDLLSTTVAHTFKDIDERTKDMKKDITEIKEKPVKNHDKLLWLVVGAIVSGVVGYYISLILVH